MARLSGSVSDTWLSPFFSSVEMRLHIRRASFSALQIIFRQILDPRTAVARSYGIARVERFK